MDVITGIERQQGRVRITVNEEVVIRVPLSLFRERPLEAGAPIDLAEYDQWLMVRQYRHALDRAVAYLAARARSTKEVADKLHQCGYLPSTVEMVICKLSQMGILNDADFAAQWVEERSGKFLGKRRIRQELQRKGIAANAAQIALEAFEDEEQQALALAQKLAPRYLKEASPKGAQKLMQALVRRGFDWETAKAAARRALMEAT